MAGSEPVEDSTAAFDATMESLDEPLVAILRLRSEVAAAQALVDTETERQRALVAEQTAHAVEIAALQGQAEQLALEVDVAVDAAATERRPAAAEASDEGES